MSKQKGKRARSDPSKTSSGCWAKGTGYGTGEHMRRLGEGPDGGVWDPKAAEATQRARDAELRVSARLEAHTATRTRTHSTCLLRVWFGYGLRMCAVAATTSPWCAPAPGVHCCAWHTAV